ELSRVHDRVGIEDSPEPGHEREIGVGELERHALRLVDADAVLARDTAAESQTGAEQFLVHALRAVDLTWHAVVEQDHRMEVAIARVKHVRDPEAMTRSDRLHLAHDLRQSRPWHHRVLQEPAAQEPPDAPPRLLPPLPEQPALRFVLRHADLERGMVAADVDDARRLSLDFLTRTVELDQEHRARTLR